MRLLLAEDEKELSRALVAVLNHEGYDVDPVYDGEEAVEKGNTDVIFEALIRSDKRLRNELMKAHLLIDDIADYLKSKTDGVENK